METNNPNLPAGGDEQWVEKRLSALDRVTQWRPDGAKALAMIRERERAYRVAVKRWILGAAAASVVVLAMVAVPAPCSAASPAACGQPMGRHLWDSVFGHQPGTPTVPEARTVPVTGKVSCEIYSDYECPACAAFYRDTYPLLVADYVSTGRLTVRHRDFPLSRHAYSRLAARYANAAERVGVFELVRNQLFGTQDIWGKDGNIEAALAPVLSTPVLRQIAGLVKNDSALEQAVTADLERGAWDGIKQTPSLVVVSADRREVIAPIPPYTLLKGYLDQVLQGR